MFHREKNGTGNYGFLLAAGAVQEVRERAEKDLAEALEIARLGDMKLFLVDLHLERARLCLAQNQPTEAKKHRDNAAQLIEKTGYKRRLTELNDLNRDGQD